MSQGAVIRDFMVALGFQTDNAGLAKMQEGLKGVEFSAASLNKALGALAIGAVLAVRQTAGELDKLYFSSQRIGASAGNINAFGNAVSQMGGNAEAALGTLENLAEKMRNSPGYNGQLNSLGVQTKEANGEIRDRVEVMKDLSVVLGKMPDYQANAYANSLGIDQHTLLAMKDGKFISNMEKYQQLQKDMGMNDELTKSGNDFMSEYRDLTMVTKTGFQVIVMQAGKALIPILKGLNVMIQAGIHAFGQLNPQIKEGLAVGLRFILLAGVFKVVLGVFGMISKVIPLVLGLTKGLKLLRLAFLASPLGIILALASALALLYDDYKTWKEGGKSLFDWSKWTNGIDKIISKIKYFLDILNKVKDKVVNFIQKVLTDPMGAIKEVGIAAAEGITELYNETKNTIANSEPVKQAGELIDQAGDWIGDKLDTIGKVIPSPISSAQAAPTPQRVNPLADTPKQVQPKIVLQPAQQYIPLPTQPKPQATPKPEQMGKEQKAAMMQAVNGLSAIVKTAQSGVNEVVPSNQNTLNLSEQDIVDIMKVTATEVVGSLKGKNFENQAAGVIDTILNRVASGGFGGKSVRAVVNKPWAFSDINSNQKTAHGSVQKVPMSRVSKRMEEFVRRYLDERANGTNSLVGQSTYYVNPNALDPKNMSENTRKWTSEVVEQGKRSGKVFGSGRSVHYHGTPKVDIGKNPKPFQISTPTSRDIKQIGSGNLGSKINIKIHGAPLGNPDKSNINQLALKSPNVTIYQEYKTDMTINGAKDPQESANAVKRTQNNANIFMMRNAQSVLV